MADNIELRGSCACERNQYIVRIPTSSASQARVFFDNSSANRRSQATPVTAWLRVPLDWYHSSTHAHFDDETHPSIRRTYHTPSIHPMLPPTRRQFCGYCGTHLTAWNEGQDREEDFLDITLGSLFNESFRMLEALNILEGEQEEDNEDETGTASEEDMDVSAEVASRQPSSQTRDTMRHVGMPYFEEMVKNHRLGQTMRQKGGHTSEDGRTTVEWEVLEIGGDAAATPMDTMPEENIGTGRSKRQKLDV